MGEKITNPEDGIQDGESNNEQSEEEMEQDEDEQDEEDMSPEEFEKINKHMDEISTALDDMEQKNDNIYVELLQLLQANREIRQQLSSSAATQKKS